MKYFFETYGCQMNTAESGALEAALVSRGWSAAADENEADLIVINTCSVRQTAENRIWGRLGYYKRLSAGRKFYLIVIGCMAERLKGEIKRKFPVVNAVVSNFGKEEIASKIEDVGIEKAMKQLDCSNSDKIDESYSFFENHGKISDVQAMLPIMNGCNNYCTYCIVPYVRGPEVSRDVSSVISEINNLCAAGVKEVTLLGQNVNSYRWEDGGSRIDFAGLLRMIMNETDIPWLRFTSSNPQDFSDGLIDVFAAEDRICNSLHLPVQHGSDRILKAMNRPYTSDYYLKLTERIKAAVPGIALTTDVMVGFPGEDESDFEKLKMLMRQVRYDEAFMYYYNPREGTAAASMTETIDEDEKHRRLSEIIDMQRGISAEEKKKRLGSHVNVLVEGVSKKDRKKLLGRTEMNNMVVFEGPVELIHRFTGVELLELVGNTFSGGKLCSS